MVWMQRRSNKYSAKRTSFQGRTYASKLEATVAAELDLRMRAGEFTSIVPQFKFEMRVNGHLICTHKVDFLCTRPDGSQIVFEAKGVATPDWRVRRNLLLALNPGIEYEVVTARKRWPRNFRKAG
jgi:hypothetical protein